LELRVAAADARTRDGQPVQACEHEQRAEEAALVRRACSDPDAFALLVRSHYTAMADHLVRRTGDEHATEDLLSELFLAAYRGLDGYRDRGIPIRFWLYRIATRLANRWARRHRRPLAPVDAARDVADPTPDTAIAAEARDEADRVRALLLELAPRHQAVLALHYLEGLGIDDVAAVLDVRPGTVKSRLSRARDQLRKRMQPRR
jgi:RNA polymerase sigma-70 factor (ECF subfamily)